MHSYVGFFDGKLSLPEDTEKLKEELKKAMNIHKRNKVSPIVEKDEEYDKWFKNVKEKNIPMKYFFALYKYLPSGYDELYKDETFMPYFQKIKSYINEFQETLGYNRDIYSQAEKKIIKVIKELLRTYCQCNTDSKINCDYDDFTEKEIFQIYDELLEIARKKKTLKKEYILKCEALDMYLLGGYEELYDDETFKPYFQKIKSYINEFATRPDYTLDTIFNSYSQTKKKIIKVIKELLRTYCHYNINPEMDYSYNNFTTFQICEIYNQLLGIVKGKKALGKIYKLKCEALKKYLPQQDNEYYHDIYVKISKLINGYNSKQSNTISEIINGYNRILQTIKTTYFLLAIKIKQDFNIDEKYLKCLNYDCNLDEFYKQLLEVKNIYNINPNIINSLKERIDEEAKRYIDYKEYNFAKEEIEKIKNETFRYIINNKEILKEFIKNPNSESIIEIFNQMHNKINETFIQIPEYLNKIEEMENTLKDIHNSEIIEFFTYLKECFYNGQNFMQFLTNIDKLNFMVKMEIYSSFSYLKLFIGEAFEEKINTSNFYNKKLSLSYKIALSIIMNYLQSMEQFCEIFNIKELMQDGQLYIIIDLILLETNLKPLSEFVREICEMDTNTIICYETNTETFINYIRAKVRN